MSVVYFTFIVYLSKSGQSANFAEKSKLNARSAGN